jgi:uncharacterized membrane protein YphA (DoxX/SURF4 family)
MWQVLTMSPQTTTKRAEACCTSPAAMCYWLVVSLIAWGAIGLVGIYWYPLHATSAAACLFAAAIGCFANWFKNRSFHCGITGPLFSVAGLVFLLTHRTGVHSIDRWVWPAVAVGTGAAFLLEWRYAKRPVS